MKKRLIPFLLAIVMLIPMTVLASRLPGNLIPLDCSKGHDYKLTTKTASTCESPGMMEMKCTRCGHVSESRRTAPLGHDWDECGYQPAKCETDGRNDYQCTRCLKTKSETIPKTGHAWVVKDSKAPTCGQTGYTAYQCAYCHQEKKDTINANGNHNWVLDNINRDDVECVAGGVAYYHCTVCMDQKNESVSATGHNWQAVFATPATCTAAKVVTYECSKCNDKKTETEGQPIAHSWKDNNVIKPATCTEDGKVSSICEMCGKKENERVVAKLGHIWGTAKILSRPTCSAAGQSESTCQTCGAKKTDTIKKLAHSYGEWQVTKEATVTETGTKERTCKNCSYKDTETIPKVGAKPIATPKPTAKPSKNTGSKSNTNLEADEGMIEVFTTSGKVNIRSNAGTNNKRVVQVEKRNTSLGELLDAKADKEGVVWFKVKYKNKTGWVTSDYARAVVGEPDGRTRRAEDSGNDLSKYIFKSAEPVADTLELAFTNTQEVEFPEWINDSVYLSGDPYVEQIVLFDEGYSLYGVKTGQKISDALKTLQKKNLVPVAESADEYIYRVSVMPDALSADEAGFCGELSVITDADNKVYEVRFYSDTAEYRYTTY